MLIDRGILVRENGAFRLEGSVETLEVPESLQALIAARLDGLGTRGAAGSCRTPPSSAARSRSRDSCAITGLPEEEVTASARLARPQGGALDLDRPAPVGPGPVRVPPGPRQEGRLRHDVEARAQGAASRGRRLPPLGVDEDEIVEVVASHLLDAYLAAPDDEDAGTIRPTRSRCCGRRASELRRSAPTRKRSATRSGRSS